MVKETYKSQVHDVKNKPPFWQLMPKAVVDYLVSKGVNPDKLTYSYYGMTRPLSDNDTEEGRAKNRRVEFTIQNN